MNIFDQSIYRAQSLFPTLYKEKRKNRSFHFAFGFRRNTLIETGLNQFEPSPKIYRLGRKFGNPGQIEYCAPHAETDLISKLLGKYYIDSSLKIVSLRISTNGLMNARPCEECQTVLRGFQINKIWYSDSKGQICLL